MIYFDLSATSQTLAFPSNGWTASDSLALAVSSTVDGTEYDLTVSGYSVSGDYLSVVVGAVPDGMAAGEYEYALTIADDPRDAIATGILIAEGDAVSSTQYNQEITYKQYGE